MQPNGGDYYRHAGIWKDRVVTNLGALNSTSDPYSGRSLAYGINDCGDVVGESAFPVEAGVNANMTHAFVYTEGKLFDLGGLGGFSCRAVAVNNVGQAAGYGTTPGDLQTHAISWQNGMRSDLGTFTGGTYSQANALNDKGRIVGFANAATTDLVGPPPPRAALWQNGAITDLGTLGGLGVYATGINKDGAVVGSAETSENRLSVVTPLGYFYDYLTYSGHGCIFGGHNSTGGLGSYTGGANVGGLNGGGTGLSGAGTGFAGGGSGRAAKRRAGGDEQSINVSHAFVYADGVMYDLNKVLPANSGWELNQASAINNKGQIVGLGTYQEQVHAYLLSPK